MFDLIAFARKLAFAFSIKHVYHFFKSYCCRGAPIWISVSVPICPYWYYRLSVKCNKNRRALSHVLTSPPVLRNKTCAWNQWCHVSKQWREVSFLENMAKEFLSAPSPSVPSERLFSGVGNLYDERRNVQNMLECS